MESFENPEKALKSKDIAGRMPVESKGEKRGDGCGKKQTLGGKARAFCLFLREKDAKLKKCGKFCFSKGRHPSKKKGKCAKEKAQAVFHKAKSK